MVVDRGGEPDGDFFLRYTSINIFEELFNSDILKRKSSGRRWRRRIK